MTKLSIFGPSILSVKRLGSVSFEKGPGTERREEEKRDGH